MTEKERREASCRANDKAVMQACGMDVKTASEPQCVARLMQMYKELAG